MHLLSSRMFRTILIVAGILAAVSIPPQPLAQTIDLSHYRMTFNQDFITMKTLNVSDHGLIRPGSYTWIAHTPYHGDWVHFQPPSGAFRPFNVGDGYLTIRA